MDIAHVLTRRFPGKQWGLVDNDYDTLEWDDESPKPTFAELEALWPQVHYEMSFEQVELARAAEFRRVCDPLFFKVQRGEVPESEWLDAVQAVRDAHPYPTPPGE